TSVKGLYPNDSWSGKHVVWTRRRCRGGTLRVTLSSGPELYKRPNRVVATGGTQPVTQIVPRLGLVTMRIPLPSGAATCVVKFTVDKTLVPTVNRSEEHTSELQSRFDLVCRLLLEKKKNNHYPATYQTNTSTDSSTNLTADRHLHTSESSTTRRCVTMYLDNQSIYI